MNHGRRVEDGVAVALREADDGDERKVRRLAHEGVEGGFRGGERVVAEEQVAAGVAGDAELREDERRNAGLGRLAGQPSHFACVRRGIP